ncbi:STAS domain-containing protein [Geodermatophilus sp. SYSU D00703]
MTLTGRLDGRTAHLLHDAVSALLGSGQPHWTVEVTELVVDHVGLRAIGRAYRRALRHDRRITLRGASPALRGALSPLPSDHHVLAGGGDPTPDEPAMS